MQTFIDYTVSKHKSILILEDEFILGEDLRMTLEDLGYQVMGEFGIEGRRYFRKGGNNRTHHIHAFQAGDHHLIRHLAFRDYLIEHETIAKEYGELKLNIAKSSNHDNDKYCDGKDPFIKMHEINALRWYKTRCQ